MAWFVVTIVGVDDHQTGLGRTKANLHYDGNENLMYMLSGKKKWTLFEPEQSPYLYEGFCKEAKLKYVKLKDKAYIEKVQSADNDLSFFNSPVNISDPDLKRFPLYKVDWYLI